MIQLTEQQVRDGVKGAVASIVDAFKGDPDTLRDDVLDRMSEETDTLFGQLVRSGRIDQYDVDDMVHTALATAIIIKVADEDASVEDDSGLWEGLTYGVQASIAYFSLRNLVYEALRAEGHDSNDDYPFAVEENPREKGDDDGVEYADPRDSD